MNIFMSDTSSVLNMYHFTLKDLKSLFLRGVISFPDYVKFNKLRAYHVRRNFRILPTINLTRMSDLDCEINFRFTQHEIRRLLVSLRIPRKCTLPSGHKFSGNNHEFLVKCLVY